jgi:hypothetical protein
MVIGGHSRHMAERRTMGKALVRLGGWSRVVLLVVGMLAAWATVVALGAERDSLALYWGLLSALALHRAKSTA